MVDFYHKYFYLCVHPTCVPVPMEARECIISQIWSYRQLWVTPAPMGYRTKFGSSGRPVITLNCLLSHLSPTISHVIMVVLPSCQPSILANVCNPALGKERQKQQELKSQTELCKTVTKETGNKQQQQQKLPRCDLCRCNSSTQEAETGRC